MIPRLIYPLLVFSLAGVALSSSVPDSETQLTPREQQELQKRIEDFYANPGDPEPLNRYLPKTAVRSGLPVHPNSFLGAAEPRATGPLARLAGQKLSPSFLAAESRFFAKHRKPGTRAQVEDNDDPEALAGTWTDIEYDTSKLPVWGATTRSVWSDDYWKTQYGQTSYRYGEGKTFKNYKEAVADYQEPAAFTTLLQKLSPDKITTELLNWSPAEKYDLTVGDAGFSLTNEEKQVGASELGPDGDVESWMGICHGWAPAAIMAPRPEKPVTIVGTQGVPVKWYPDDVRAVLSLSWANADYTVNNAGGRCEEKTPETFPNGRIKDQDCFDTNPSTFHLALTNMIGRALQSFVIDSSFDYEVWNQPMLSYKLTYFNPLDPTEQDTDWTQVAVAYDDTFKAQDRFQHPLTRGMRQSDGTWDDSGVQKVVGVIATIVYLDEITPTATDVSPADNPTRVTYTYDLEFYDDDGLTAEGGEWHNNTHPDFLWIPTKDSVAVADQDSSDLGFTGKAPPASNLTQAAAAASADGLPLCQVVKQLLTQSANSNAVSYSCGD